MAPQPRFDYIVTVTLNTGEVLTKEINTTTAYMAEKVAKGQFAKDGIQRADYIDPVTRKIKISAELKSDYEARIAEAEKAEIAEEAPKHIVGRRGCKRCGLPNGAPFDCKPEEEAPVQVTDALIKSLDTDKLRKIAGVMTSGMMMDEQKSVLMKIEEELAQRASKDMEWIERKNVTLKKIESFLTELMDGKGNSQELDAYDFERHGLAIAKYASLVPVIH